MQKFLLQLKQNSDEKRAFSIGSESLTRVAQLLEEAGISVEEAEIMAEIESGDLLQSLEKDAMLQHMDLFKLIKILSD